MKNNVIISLVVSVFINLVGMLINYLSFVKRNYLMFSIKMPGGECMNENGFGLNVFHTYAMLPEDHDRHKLTFSILGLILSVLAIGFIVYVLLFVIRKLLRK